ncbi:MAG: hypothetical protein KIT44_06490 [Opitutaceae bacterium]|nr:hypothetical protein [Opitutaceae bacterium]
MNPATTPSRASGAEGIVWLPSETMYVRRIPIDAAADVAEQVALNLEAHAPFSLEQLCHGWILAPSDTEALVMATHRRLFPVGDWSEAKAVLPAFLPLLGGVPDGPVVRLWQRDGVLVLAAWDEGRRLPACVLARRCGDREHAEVRKELLAVAGQRLGGSLPAVEEQTGHPVVREVPRSGGCEFGLVPAGASTGSWLRLSGPQLEAADLRDKTVLLAQRRRVRRDGWLWRGAAAAAAAVVLAVIAEGALMLAGGRMEKTRTELQGRAEAVREIEAAHALGNRIEELAGRRFRPLEMLAMLNQVRPAGIQFLRCSNQGLWTLEIEAQSTEAAGVGGFESALRALPALASVEIRDVRLRDGITTFQLQAVFRENFWATGGRP